MRKQSQTMSKLSKSLMQLWFSTKPFSVALHSRSQASIIRQLPSHKYKCLRRSIWRRLNNLKLLFSRSNKQMIVLQRKSQWLKEVWLRLTRHHLSTFRIKTKKVTNLSNYPMRCIKMVAKRKPKRNHRLLLTACLDVDSNLRCWRIWIKSSGPKSMDTSSSTKSQSIFKAKYEWNRLS